MTHFVGQCVRDPFRTYSVAVHGCELDHEAVCDGNLDEMGVERDTFHKCWNVSENVGDRGDPVVAINDRKPSPVEFEVRVAGVDLPRPQ